MPFISETASAIKRRFGFNDRAGTSESARAVPCTPDPSAVSRENHAHHQGMVRRMGDLEEEAEISGGSAAQISRSHSFEFNEDPAFWKDHNVQVDSVALRDSQLYMYTDSYMYTAACRLS